MIKPTKDGIQIKVRATPRSAKDCVEGLEGDYIKVRLRAIPEKGKANESIIKILADFFDLAPSKISIISGQTSRIKTVDITTDDIHEIEKKIRELPIKK
jgi:uncharacterized protein (TIGR00251 family)